MLKYRTHKRNMSPTERKRVLKIKSVKHHPPLPLLFAFCCLSALHFSSGFPQSAAHYVDGLDIPESERLAFCFSQWTAPSDQDQPQVQKSGKKHEDNTLVISYKISNFVMDLCSSIYNRMKVNEENKQEIYKRFLFHYSRAQDPAFKTGESHISTEEFTKKDSSGTMGRPFFLFRPRNGRKVSTEN